MFIKKLSFIILFIFISISIALSSNEPVFLNLDAPQTKNLDSNTIIINCPGDDTLPRNWRMSTEPLKTKDINIPSLEGFNTLNISGSGAFSTGQFEKMRQAFGDRKVIIIDLRQESHLLINNMCISWYKVSNNLNEDKKLYEITNIEKDLMNKLNEDGNVYIDNILKRPDLANSDTWEIVKVHVKVKTVMTEEEFVTKQGYDYYRIAVPDYQRPEDNDVENFVILYKKLSPNTWFHFHCKAGKGRVTTFMIMCDMMKNYDKVTKEDIIKRQWLAGGINLLDTENDDNFNTEWAKARLDFLFKFYDYCSENGPDYKKTWSEWIK